MDNELVSLDRFKEQITEDIRTRFANFIPQDKLDSFVDDTVKNFISEDLERLVKEELRIYLQKELRLLFESTNKWNPNTGENITRLRPELEKILEENAVPMMIKFMQEIGRSTFSSLKNELYNNNLNGGYY